ncbi:neurotrypsin-like [Asterias amurensis]|uniref:neurotrypsin-like n=1 Tax=Asterias amurensis TaxID=7602 RepID=UPI003AB3E156
MTMEASVKIAVFISSLLVILARCKAQDIFSLRVVNSTSITTPHGRLEVFYKDQWGRICAEGWDFYDALVSCRQLGYHWVNYLGLDGDKEGRGEEPTWLSNVGCVGSERSLERCPNDGWMRHECSGSFATVWCTNEASNLEVEFFSYIHFATEGGLLIRPYPDSEPYLVCDKGWDKAEADVICRQMGFPSAARATTGSYFGEHPSRLGHQLKYIATGLKCQGNESSIGECRAEMWFTEQCPPSHEAGVVCNRREELAGFQVRLVSGKNQHEGLLEIFYKDRWVTIYIASGDDYFSRTVLFSVGTVVCRQLGYGYLMDVTTDDRFGEIAVPIAIENMRCSRDEESLAQCEFDEMDADDGSPANGAAVGFICSGALPEGKHPIRFAYPGVNRGSQSGRSTYLEIFYDGKWGTICNTDWTRENSIVACRELGYSHLWYDGNGLGSGGSGYKGPILQEGITCKGDEERLDQCELGTWSQHQCSHKQDVSLGCSKSIESTTKKSPLTTADAAVHQGHAAQLFFLMFLISFI